MLLVLAAASAVPVELGFAWAEFSRAEMLRHVTTRVEVGTLGYDRARDRPDFWVRRTVTTLRGEQVSWIDARNCPAVRPALASMRSLPVPRFAPVGSSKGPPMYLDGNGYFLRSYSDDGMLTEETSLGTPLASWVEATLKALGPCWASTVPRRLKS